MLFVYFLSSVLLLSPTFHVNAKQVEHADVVTKDADVVTKDADVNSDRQIRQYLPAFAAPPSRPMFYGQPWYSSYLPQYSSYDDQFSPQLRYPYGVNFKSQDFSDEPILSWNNKNQVFVRYGEKDDGLKSRQSNQNYNQILSSSPVINNPNSPNLLNLYDSCKDPNGLSGVCLPNSLCRVNGGRSSGSCSVAAVCCINTVNACGKSAVLNNTYWQSPAIIDGGNCDLTISLSRNFYILTRPICQIRLDFVGFSLNQPNEVSSVCDIDRFSLTGVKSEDVPVICGQNDGQHIYVTPEKAFTDVGLKIKIGTESTFVRSWNIKIALLPCGASYLAPPNCLQYFTQPVSQITSFNYADVPLNPIRTRQLASQEYQICFRKELIGDLVATRACFTPCRNAKGGSSFSLSKTAVAFNSAAADADTDVANCPGDFLMIQDGFDPNAPTVRSDRYCGSALHPDTAATASTTVCTTVKDFNIYYKTNAVEGITEVGNVGFCLDYEQRVV